MRKLKITWFVFNFFMGLALSSWAAPNHLVVGYSASWFDPLYPPESYNYETLTHINRSFLIPKPDGSITTQDNFWDSELEKRAHAHGVKLIASVGGASTPADQWLTMARNPDSLKRFFDGLEKLITSNNYDGVDIDWEPTAETDADQQTYSTFMKALRQRFPKWIITTALGGAEYWAKHISWAVVAEQVDFINLMTYDFAGNWAGKATYNATLYPSQDSNKDGGLSDNEIVTRLETKYKVPADKIVLGVPFYGVQFQVKHMGDSFPKDSKGQGSEIQYYDIAPLVANKGYSTLWDKDAKVPYLEKIKGDHVIAYENIKSMGFKCQFAAEKGLKGVMIWNLGADIVGARTPLLDTIAQAFGVKPMPMPAEGLKKTFQSFATTTKESYNKLLDAYNKLLAGKSSGAKAAKPGHPPDFTLPDSVTESVLKQKVWELQFKTSVYNTKLRDCQMALEALPTPQGTQLSFTGEKLLVDDFEGGTSVNRLNGNWTTDQDHNNLGTALNPTPFKPSAGGSETSPKFAAHIWGHYGKSQSPWPTAQLVGTLSPDNKPVDLSSFKAVQFWAKGDGKTYSVILAKALVQDSAHYRQDFKTTKEWTKVTLNLADFKQPDWGKAVPRKFNDVPYLSFSPTAKFNDESLDLWVDDITLMK